MTEEDDEDHRNNNICSLCEKKIESDKVRDHCHLAGKNTGPAHNTCIINVTQDQSNFIPFEFHNFSTFDCQCFFQKLIYEKNDKVKFKTIPKTKKECISVRYGCIRFIDSFRFLSSSSDNLVKILLDSGHKILKDLDEEIADNDEILKNVKEIKRLNKERKQENDSIKDLKKISRRNYKNRKNFT